MAMSEFTGASVETREQGTDFFSALTIEAALYAGLVFSALAIRFFILDLAPLNSTEAQQALGALSFVRGNASPITGSPLLFALDSIFFTLFGASDFIARLPSAIFGTLLVLFPAFFRRDLGRPGALIASALLAFSPSLVFYSRALDAAVPATVCALATILFFSRYLETRVARDLYWAGAFVAFALLTAPDIWTIATALGIYALASRFRLVNRFENRNPETQTNAPSQDKLQSVKALLFFFLVFTGTATVFLLHREGLGAAFDLLGSWFESLRFGGSLPDVVRLLIVYEPLALFFGLAALLDIFFSPKHNRSNLMELLGIWFLVAFLLLSFSANNSPARIVVIVVPLALLAGANIGEWAERAIDAMRSASTRELLMHEAPILAVAVGLISFLSVVLAELAQRGNILSADALARLFGSALDNPGVSGTIVALLFLIAFVATSVLAITTLGSIRAKVLGVIFALALLSLWTLRQTAMLNFPAGGALNIQEWMIARAASPNVRDLVSDIKDMSRWRANDTHTIVIAVDSSLGPILEWNLRDMANARFLERPAAAPDVQALVLTANSPAPAEEWIAQKYQIEMTRGVPAGALRALIFRDVGSIDSNDAVLWVLKPH